jgi:dihydrofolate reductase
MRKLIFGINLSIDGCCDHTKMNGDEEIHDYFGRLMWEAGTLVYGRITYQLMVPFWPDLAKSQAGPTRSMNEFAKAFDSVSQIVVFSKSLQKPDGEKTRIVRMDIRAEILRLKQEPGKDILLGGVDLPSQLMEMDLIDEYRFVIQPVLVGEGRRLLAGVKLREKLKLKLLDSTTFKSGSIALRYAKA